MQAAGRWSDPDCLERDQRPGIGTAGLVHGERDIEFAAVPRKAGRYELKSHAGDIWVFTGPVGFEFEANTVKGEVSSDVPTRPGNAGSHQVRGSVGDGSAYFDLTTFTGDIKVVRKP